MKKYLYILIITVFAASCDKELNVQPTQSIDQTSALATAQDVKVTLIGAYDGLSDGDVLGGGVQIAYEVIADDKEIVFRGTFTTLDEYWRKVITTTNSQTLDTWRDSYVAINRANNVLSALDKLDNADKGPVEGEARFIRGLTYFNLVNLFAKTWGDGDNAANPGVPLVTSPTLAVTEADDKPRASVAAVYTQILEDLTKAEQFLPAKFGGASFASRVAAKALLSRVYMTQGNYAEALKKANEVIGSGDFDLSSDYADLFDDNSGGYDAETIFKISVTDQDGVNNLNTYFAPAAFSGRGDLVIQPKHIALYSASDVRGKFTQIASNRLYTKKFNNQFGDLTIVRLAEMYLNRAEANFRLSSSVGATPLADINLIRSRAAAGSITQANLTLSKIILERKLELAFEGNLMLDVKRNKLDVGTLPFSAPALVSPIPQREIDTNKSLVQNPGY